MTSHKADPRCCEGAFKWGVQNEPIQVWGVRRVGAPRLPAWKEPFQKPRAGEDGSFPRSAGIKEERGNEAV